MRNLFSYQKQKKEKIINKNNKRTRGEKLIKQRIPVHRI